MKNRNFASFGLEVQKKHQTKSTFYAWDCYPRCARVRNLPTCRKTHLSRTRWITPTTTRIVITWDPPSTNIPSTPVTSFTACAITSMANAAAQFVFGAVASRFQASALPFHQDVDGVWLQERSRRNQMLNGRRRKRKCSLERFSRGVKQRAVEFSTPTLAFPDDFPRTKWKCDRSRGELDFRELWQIRVDFQIVVNYANVELVVWRSELWLICTNCGVGWSLASPWAGVRTIYCCLLWRDSRRINPGVGGNSTNCAGSPESFPIKVGKTRANYAFKFDFCVLL